MLSAWQFYQDQMKLEPGGCGGKTAGLGDPRFQVDFNHSYYVASGKPQTLSELMFL